MNDENLSLNLYITISFGLWFKLNKKVKLKTSYELLRICNRLFSILSSIAFVYALSKSCLDNDNDLWALMVLALSHSNTHILHKCSSHHLLKSQQTRAEAFRRHMLLTGPPALSEIIFPQSLAPLPPACQRAGYALQMRIGLELSTCYPSSSFYFSQTLSSLGALLFPASPGEISFPLQDSVTASRKPSLTCPPGWVKCSPW